MKTLYLCGPINGCTDAQASDWRDATKAELSNQFRILDPMRRDYRGREDDCAADIVAGDMEDIAESDIVLVFGERATWGTAMECFHAFRSGKRVVVVCSGTVSPWLRQHSERVVPSLFGAWSVLKKWAAEP